MREIRSAAHEWRAALAQRDVSHDQRERFREWIQADIRHEAAFDRAVTLFEALGTLDKERLGPDVMRTSWRERSLGWLFFSSTGTRAPLRAAGAATTVVFAAILVLVLSDTMEGPSRARNLDSIVYSTNVGELETVNLVDGTTVTLDAKSTLRVAFEEQRRHLTLESGAALFDVFPDPERPFTVEAGALSATAIGTRFGVRNNGGVARVAVAEGEVGVTHPVAIAGGTTSLLSRASLKEGQQVAATETSGLGGVEAIPSTAVAAWRAKRLVYAGATLGELIADAKRHSQLEITVLGDTSSLQDIRVSAFFDGRDIRGMLNTLPEILPVTVDEAPSGSIEIRPLP